MRKHKDTLKEASPHLPLHNGERLYKNLIFIYDQGRRGIKLMSKLRQDGLIDSLVYREDLNPEGPYLVHDGSLGNKGITETKLDLTFGILFAFVEKFSDTKIAIEDYSPYSTFEEQMAAINRGDIRVVADVDNCNWKEFCNLPGAMEARGFSSLENAFEHFHRLRKNGAKARLLRVPDLPESQAGMLFRVIEISEI